MIVPGERGGPPGVGRARCLALSRELTAAGFEVNTLSSDPTVADGLPVRAAPSTADWRNPLCHFGLFNQPGLLMAGLDLRPDVVVLPTSFSLPSALLLGGLGIPVVVDFPRVEEDLVRLTGGGSVVGPHLRAVERLAAREPEGLMTTTEEDKAILVKRHAAHPRRILVVPPLAASAEEPRSLGEEVVACAWRLTADDAAALQSLDRGLRSRGAGRLRRVEHPAELGPALRRARCLVAFVRGGSGARPEIAEALGLGVPVVAAPAALRGYEVLNGSISVAEEPDAAATLASSLVKDASAARDLGRAGWDAWRDRPSLRPELTSLIERAARAHVDSQRKLRLLGEIPGRWPGAANEVREFLARRPRRVGTLLFGGPRRRFLRDLV